MCVNETTDLLWLLDLLWSNKFTIKLQYYTNHADAERDVHASLYLLIGNWWVLDSLLSLLWKLDESGTSLPGTSVMLGKGFWLGLTQSEQFQWYPKSIADNDCTPTRYMRYSIVMCSEVKGKDDARANNGTWLKTDSASGEAKTQRCILSILRSYTFD